MADAGKPKAPEKRANLSAIPARPRIAITESASPAKPRMPSPPSQTAKAVATSITAGAAKSGPATKKH